MEYTLEKACFSRYGLVISVLGTFLCVEAGLQGTTWTSCRDQL